MEKRISKKNCSQVEEIEPDKIYRQKVFKIKRKLKDDSENKESFTKLKTDLQFIQ